MYAKLDDFLSPEQIVLNADMRKYTTFQIGGPADILVMPRTIDEVLNALEFCREKSIPYFLLGQGSNILVRDKGIRGMVIKLGNCLKQLEISGSDILAQAGVSLSDLAWKAAKHGLSGLEFAEGIPGTLGGAVVMNAGAYGGEMQDIIYEVTAIDSEGHFRTFKREELEFGYRSSIFQKEFYIVLAARLHLQPGKPEEITATMTEYSRRRSEKQPLEYPSAGSTFKRPEGFFVGPIIEELGLKGFSVGGAQVSGKHAGFIINKGQAVAEDVIQLIRHLQEEIKEKHGVDLIPEIKIVGEE